MEGYVLKEKLKFLKTDLKLWNLETFGHMDKLISGGKKKKSIIEADKIDNIFGLEEEEVIRRNQCMAELLRTII